MGATAKKAEIQFWKLLITLKVCLKFHICGVFTIYRISQASYTKANEYPFQVCVLVQQNWTLPIDFSSDFSASVVLWCTSAVESVTLDSELLELVCFAPSASEGFWDNWSWLVNFSCYMTLNREKKTPSEWKSHHVISNYTMTEECLGTACCYLKCFFRDSHLSPDNSKKISM